MGEADVDLKVDVEEKNGGIPLVFLRRHLSKNFAVRQVFGAPLESDQGNNRLIGDSKRVSPGVWSLQLPTKKKKRWLEGEKNK